MLKLKDGCKIPFPEKLHESYMIEGNMITANIDINHIESVMQHFIVMHEEPIFFILELPAKADDETEIRPGVVETLHKDIYYLDGCSQEEALTIIHRVGQLLFHDGISSFGYGGHNSGDEIMFSKYNVLTIFSHDIDQYRAFFEKHEIVQVDKIITAWDTFTLETPGISERVIVDGKDVYSIPEQFKDWGMYLAEQREE